MEEFESIDDLAVSIKTKLDTATDKKKVIAVYAFNATWKTRLSNLLDWNNEDLLLEAENWETLTTENNEWIELDAEKLKTLCYNAFVEDIFKWDNENYILKFDVNSLIMKVVIEQWLETEIINNFKDIVNTDSFKLEPSFDFLNWEVIFQLASGDDESLTNIKISKGEESIFIWSVFYTILETAISELIIKKDNRSTKIFNDLEYIIIDDPVSSIDDTKIVTLAVKLVHLIKNDHISEHLEITRKELEEQEFAEGYINNRLIDLRAENYSEIKLKFLLTTHHALYYNVLVNSFRQEVRGWTFQSFSMSKNDNKYIFKKQWDSPFSYHLAVKKLIQNAIDSDSVEKYHFNLFRALLEKTSNFLGYKDFYDCITWDNKQESTRLLNHYSHNRLSDLESNELSNRDIQLFTQAFNQFIENFKYN